MPKGPGPMSGPKPKTPARGMNGPGDKGPADGVRHRAHPAMPPVGKGRMTGTVHSKGKYEKGK